MLVVVVVGLVTAKVPGDSLESRRASEARVGLVLREALASTGHEEAAERKAEDSSTTRLRDPARTRSGSPRRCTGVTTLESTRDR